VSGAIVTILLSGALLETGWLLTGWLLFPGMWLAGATFGSRIANSESGAHNFVALVFAGAAFNLLIYSALSYFVLGKVERSKRRRGKLSQ
jgi:uncharacterized membrane protein AbrB (regulator of aidB expression)